MSRLTKVYGNGTVTLDAAAYGIDQNTLDTEIRNSEPCPFCGGKAEMLEGFTFRIRGIAYFVHCPKCDTMSGFYGTKRVATKKWNRRADNG